MALEERDLKYTDQRAIRWVSIYLALALLPLVAAYVGPRPEARAFWVEFGVALGFLGMAMMCLQFLFSGRFNRVAPHFGNDNVLQFHREAGIIGTGFLLAHPVILILADPEFTAYLDPRVNALRAVFLGAAAVGLLLLLATTLWRERFRLEYEWWRLLHGAIAVGIVLVGIAHGLQVEHYLDAPGRQILWVLIGGGAIYLVVHTRLVRLWKMKRRPYRIVGVQREQADATTLELEAVGHPGMSYRPGQFAWITLGETPFRLQQHPFSFASSPLEEHIRFTAKVQGDFTASWPEMKIGTTAYLEGPFGAFTPNPEPRIGAFFVVGGIGVTPAMSMLRTMRRTGDTRQATLLYANVSWDQVIFREEIEELEQHLDLTVVHVLEEPPDDWGGETGLLSQELLERYLPQNEHEYFLCGPKPMMNIAERALRGLGVDWRRIYSERFEIV